jgi:hypothetical protein
MVGRIRVAGINSTLEGMAVLEEGTMDGTKIELEMVYVASGDGVLDNEPIKVYCNG